MTLFLILTLIAVSLGWFTDHVRSNQNFKREIEEVHAQYNWTCHSFSLRTELNTYRELVLRPETAKQTYRMLILSEIVETWRTYSSGNDEKSKRATHEMLSTLKIKNTDDFFTEIVAGLKAAWPHVTDPTNQDYGDLENFIDSSLDLKYANKSW